MGYWAVIVAAFAAAAGLPQAEVDPVVLTLARVKLKMSENLSGLPNYTCLQTIERSHRRTGSRRYELIDTMRLEVGLVGGSELFAWPGAGRFDDRKIEEFAAPGGAIGNGSFALNARAVFLGTAPVFRFAGRERAGGRDLLRYDFEVAQAFSGYRVRVGTVSAIVGYRGSFWADAGTFDLERLEIQAVDLPPQLQLASLSDATQYARVPIGESEFLLPASSEMSMIDIRGNENRNRTRFTSCQHYAGESVVRFDDPPETGAAPAQPSARAIELPADLSLEVELTAPIESGKSAIGDPVTAVLYRDARVKGRTVAPKGSRLLGRLVHMERRAGVYGRGPAVYYLLGFEFDTLETDTGRAAFAGRLDEVGPMAAPGLRGDAARPVVADWRQTGAAPRSGVGAILIRGDTIRLNRGFRMIWRVILEPGG